MNANYPLLDKPFISIELKNERGDENTLTAILSKAKDELLTSPAASHTENLCGLVTQVFVLADKANSLVYAIQGTLPVTPHHDVNKALAGYSAASLESEVLGIYYCCVLTLGMLAASQGNAPLTVQLRSLAKQLIPAENSALYIKSEVKSEFLLDILSNLAANHNMNKEDLVPHESRKTLEAELRETFEAMHFCQDSMYEILTGKEQKVN